MPTMTVDLGDVEDLRHARAVIDARLKELGDAPVSPASDATDESESDESETHVDDPEAFARRLWNRIQTENTRELVRAFAELDQPFTLEQVTAHLGVEPSVVRARKFRFGRTQNKLREEFGAPLLDEWWDTDENGNWCKHYAMDADVQAALKKLTRSE